MYDKWSERILSGRDVSRSDEFDQSCGEAFGAFQPPVHTVSTESPEDEPNTMIEDLNIPGMYRQIAFILVAHWYT